MGLNIHILRLLELLLLIWLLHVLLLMLRVALDLVLSLLESIVLKVAAFYRAGLILVPRHL